MEFNYYDNSHLCGECTGAGCKQCVGGLSGTGNERFPLSRTINGCIPPEIKNTFALNLSPEYDKFISNREKNISFGLRAGWRDHIVPMTINDFQS